MLNRLKREEAQLTDLFGSAYQEYRHDVRPYLPTVNKRFRPEHIITFNPQTFARNSGWLNIGFMCVGYVLLGIFSYAG